MDGTQHTAGIAVKLIIGVRISDFVDSLTGDMLDVDVCFRTYFSGDDDLSSGNHRLDGTVRFCIECQEMVHERITNLIADFIRMSGTD